MSGYLLTGIVFGLIVGFDGAKRLLGIKALIWMLGSIILWPVVTPLYFARRPLKEGERRVGGTFWHWVRNFVALWTLGMIGISLVGLMGASTTMSAVQSGAELAGTVIGTSLGIGLLCAIWLMPTLVLLVLGLVAKSDDIEEGPTGPFAEVAILQGISEQYSDSDITRL